LLLLVSPAHAQSQWTTYTNGRFAFVIEYPRDVFSSLTESDNSDGATFASKQPGYELRAFGFFNVERLTPQAEFAERYKRPRSIFKLESTRETAA
jgi:hypothetical protein